MAEDRNRCSPQNLKKISEEIKTIFSSNKDMLFDQTTLEKVSVFGQAIAQRSKSPSNSLVSLLEITWKNFLYPIIALCRQNSCKEIGDSQNTQKFLEFLKIFNAFLETSKANVSSLPGNSYSHPFLYKVCLIQADIFKYISELDSSFPTQQSENYYLEVIALDPSDGIPFNQAGTLVKEVEPLKSIIYFYLATLSYQPCHISETNAASVLNKHREEFFKHIKSKEIIKEKNKLCEISFMNLLDAFLNRMDDISPDRINRLMSNFHKIFSDFFTSCSFDFEAIFNIYTKIIVLLALTFEKAIIFPSICEKFVKIFKKLSLYFCDNLLVLMRKMAEMDIKQVLDTVESDDEAVDRNLPVNDTNFERHLFRTFYLLFGVTSKLNVGQKHVDSIGFTAYKIFHYAGHQLTPVESKIDELSIFSVGCQFILDREDFVAEFPKLFSKLVDKSVYDIVITSAFTPEIKENSQENLQLVPDEKSSSGSQSPIYKEQIVEAESQKEAIPLNSKPSNYNLNLIIPLSDIFVNNLTQIIKMVDINKCTIHVLAAIFDTLDSNKENKATRDAIHFINDHFSQGSKTVVPQNEIGGFESRTKHRNRIFLELSEALKYSKQLIGDHNEIIKPKDVSIIVPEGVVENHTLYDLVEKTKEFGIQVIEISELVD